MYKADEHKEGKDYLLPDKFYSYVTIEHPTLGEFYLSVGTLLDGIRTDGLPWVFIQKEPLTKAQLAFVNKYKKQLDDACNTTGPKVTFTIDKNTGNVEYYD